MKYDYLQKQIRKTVSPEVYDVYKHFADKAPIGGGDVTLITIREIMKVANCEISESYEYIYEMIKHELIRKIIKIEPVLDKDVFFIVVIVPTKSDSEKIMENLTAMAMKVEDEEDGRDLEEASPNVFFDIPSILSATGGITGVMALIESVIAGDIKAEKSGNMLKITIEEMK